VEVVSLTFKNSNLPNKQQSGWLIKVEIRFKISEKLKQKSFQVEQTIQD